MATIVIKDLEENRELDRKALASVIGGSSDDFNRSIHEAYQSIFDTISSNPRLAYRGYLGSLYAQNYYSPYLDSLQRNYGLGGLMAEADRMINLGRSLGLGP